MATNGNRRQAAPPAKVPVTVITGFLGAGKTTLINRILTEHHRKYAVIENEFGDVGVDDALIKLHSETQIVEKLNGCVCCTVRGDLVKILSELLDRKVEFDGIIIETTGLADPAPVAQTFFMDDNLRRRLFLDAILTVVDAKHVTQHLDDEKPEGVENEAVEQLAFADIVLLNKVDLVNEKEKAAVIKRIRGINKAVDILETTHSAVSVDRIIGVRAFSLDRVLEMEPAFLDEDGEDHQHDDRVTSVSIEAEGQLHPEAINLWLSELMVERGADIFRSKGVLSIAGSDDKVVFQAVHMLMMMGFTGTNGIEQGWGPNEKRINRLVFIGRNLDAEELNASFRDCLINNMAISG